MLNFLDEIITKKRKRITEAKECVSLNELQNRIKPHYLNTFKSALIHKNISLIAEVKRSSPSAGTINTNCNPTEQAQIYIKGGANALSVLTEEDYFKGSPDDLRAVKKNVSLPVVRKDFIIDEYQVYETATMGADALLLIAAALNQKDLFLFHSLATELGLDCIAEVHNENDIQKLKGIPVSIIGVNNRDLNSFTVDLETSIRLYPLLPKNVVTISESGIKTRGHVVRLQETGFNAILVGELLMRSNNPESMVKELLGTGNGES